MSQFTMLPFQLTAVKTFVVNGEKKSFSLNHKVVYMYLEGWKSSGQQVFPSLSLIADTFGLSKRTVQNCLDDLIGAGLIKKENRAFTSNLYYPLALDEALRVLGVAPSVKKAAAKTPVENQEEDDAPYFFPNEKKPVFDEEVEW